MEETIEAVLDQSIAEPTRRRYDSTWKRYMAWCSQLGEMPLPVTEDTAMAYMVALVQEGLRVKTVKYHLAELRMAQIKAGMATPEWGAMSRLAQLRKGLARIEALGEKEKLRREPVKWSHMLAMKAVWKAKGERGTMLWAAACTCFFGCLRAGEALAPERGEFDEKAHLGWEDVQMENAASPRWIRLRIKESKMDRLREGAFVTLPRTDLDICPVRAVLEFMVVRKAGSGPFFRDREKGGLTRRDFVSEVRKALAERGMPDAGISGHSFRIGAATAVAVSGASDEEVKALGRWRSREYKGYVRREEGDQAASAKKWAETVKAEKE